MTSRSQWIVAVVLAVALCVIVWLCAGCAYRPAMTTDVGRVEARLAGKIDETHRLTRNRLDAQRDSIVRNVEQHGVTGWQLVGGLAVFLLSTEIKWWVGKRLSRRKAT